MKHEPYSSRRTALLKHIGDGVAIIPTAPERVRNRDSHHLYRFDSYFWYLSGFPEPEAVIVLVGGRQKKSILFCRDKNEEREVWEGFRYGPDAARDAFGFDESYPFSLFDAMLPDLIANHEALWHALGHDTAWDAKIVTALNAVRNYRGQEALDRFDFQDLMEEKIKLLQMPEDLLTRSVNVGFSGGEKKRNDILQMAVLEPELCILDESDSGLDIDALKIVSQGVNALRDGKRALIIVTHYQRILDYIKPDYVHVLYQGRIVKSGDFSLVKQLEEQGYGWLTEQQ